MALGGRKGKPSTVAIALGATFGAMVLIGYILFVLLTRHRVSPGEKEAARLERERAEIGRRYDNTGMVIEEGVGGAGGGREVGGHSAGAADGGAGGGARGASGGAAGSATGDVAGSGPGGSEVGGRSGEISSERDRSREVAIEICPYEEHARAVNVSSSRRTSSNERREIQHPPPRQARSGMTFWGVELPDWRRSQERDRVERYRADEEEALEADRIIRNREEEAAATVGRGVRGMGRGVRADRERVLERRREEERERERVLAREREREREVLREVATRNREQMQPGVVEEQDIAEQMDLPPAYHVVAAQAPAPEYVAGNGQASQGNGVGRT